MERLTDQNMTLDESANSAITDYGKILPDFNLIESNTNITLIGRNNPPYGLIYSEEKTVIIIKQLKLEL